MEHTIISKDGEEYQFECVQQPEIKDIKEALYGNGNDRKGMIKKVDEMHAVFTSTQWSLRTIVKFFAGVGIIIGSISAFIVFAKHILKLIFKL